MSAIGRLPDSSTNMLKVVFLFIPIKRERRDIPPLKAKNFLRVSVTPAFRLSSLGIVPNLHAVRKGADFVTNDFEENSERSVA